MTEERYSAFRELTRARILSLLREPGALFWVFVFPVLMAVALGIAFRTKPPESLIVAVVANTPSAEAAADAIGRFDGLTSEVMPRVDAEEAIRTGKVDLLVERDAGDEARYLYRYDPTRSPSRTARLLTEGVLESAAGRTDLLTSTDEHVSEAGSRYIDFLLPGLIGLNLMGSGMWGVGFVIVMARVRKQLKRLAATPMRRSHYLLSMMSSRLVLLGVELAALLFFGRWIFGVRVQGSFLHLSLVAVLGGAAFTGLALLVGSRARSVEVASGLMNFVMLPMWMLSGSFFSYERFPEAVQPIIRALPLTALNDALRAIMNDGAGLKEVSLELAILAAWGVASFVVALKIFRWQ